MKLDSGHEAVPLEGEEFEKQKKDWKGYEEGLVRLTPGRWLFPHDFTRFADKLYNFKYRAGDVVVMTYPKCGTTWTQEIVWTMRNNPDLNNPAAQAPVMIRVPFIEADMLAPPKPGEDLSEHHAYQFFLKSCPGKDPHDGMNIQMAEALKDPRTIKTHLPFSLMPPSLLDTTKVVYVARNPKDVIVSYLHHCRLIKVHGFVGSFDDFVQYFVEDDLMYGPYGLNVKEAWERKDHPNLHIVFYEDMKANPLEEFKKLDAFLGTKLTEEQLKNVIKHTSFGEMKSRSEMARQPKEGEKANKHFDTEFAKKEGGFFRKGVSGDWKNKFTPEAEAKVDKWIKENMSSFGINFKYGI